MSFEIELHLGLITAVHEDGTIDITDFKSTTQTKALFKNVPLLSTAASSCAPLVGQEALYATINTSAKKINPRVIKIFSSVGSIDWQRAQNVPFPVVEADSAKREQLNLAPGEHRISSTTGATAYAANGALYLGSLGQSLTFDDDTMTAIMRAVSLSIVTYDGFEIRQTRGTNNIVISHGTINKDTGAIENPDVVITVGSSGVSVKTAASVSVDAADVSVTGTSNISVKTSESVTIDASKIILNGGTQNMVRGNDLLTAFNNHQHMGNLGTPTSAPVVPLTKSVLSQKDFVE